MNISRNVLLAALVTLTLPVIATEEPGAAAIETAKVEPKVEANKPAPAPEADKAKTPEAKNVEKPKADKSDATSSEPKEESKSFLGKAGAFFAAPFVFAGNGALSVVDTVASYGGAKALVDYLASASKDKDGNAIAKGRIATFFSDHGSKVQRTLAFAEVVAVACAIKVAYDKFVVANEDNDEDDYNLEFVDFADNN